jgi:hypothetical protein
MAKEIVINELRCISDGQFSKVFHGTYDGIPVAVKRVNVEAILSQDEFQRFHYLDPEQSQRPHRQVSFVREESALIQLSYPEDEDHPNVVKLLAVKDEHPFRY